MSVQYRKYWVEQAKANLLRVEAQTGGYVNELLSLYERAALEVETNINAMFAKYAIDNNMTAAEASRLLSGKEYSVWKKSLKEYVADVSTSAEGSKTLLELNTLSAKSRISRQEQLLSNIYKSMIDLSGDSNVKLNSLLSDMLITNYERSCYTLQRGFQIGFNVPKLNDTLIKQVMECKWSNKHYSEALWGQIDNLTAVIKREVTIGFIKGSGCQEIARQINAVMDKGMYAAERLARTECKFFANQAQLEAYRSHGVKRYKFIGGGEGGKCNCADLNGMDFSIDEAEAGINLPPIHPNCLCTTIACFDMSLFDNKRNVTPLSENIKFEEWKARYTT